MTRSDGATAGSAAALLIVPWLVSGCLSVDERDLTVKPEPIALSSFENMSEQALDPRFGAWEPGVYAAADGAVFGAAVVSPGHNSNWALEFDWQVTDPPDGRTDNVGAAETIKAPGGIDISHQERIVLTHLYQHTGACRSIDNLRVRLLCSRLGAGYEGVVLVASDWKVSTLELSSFLPLNFLAAADKDACLGVFDELQIVAEQSTPADGTCASGTLLLDDVSIR